MRGYFQWLKDVKLQEEMRNWFKLLLFSLFLDLSDIGLIGTIYTLILRFMPNFWIISYKFLFKKGCRNEFLYDFRKWLFAFIQEVQLFTQKLQFFQLAWNFEIGELFTFCAVILGNSCGATSMRIEQFCIFFRKSCLKSAWFIVPYVRRCESKNSFWI